MSMSGEADWSAMTSLAERVDSITGDINQQLTQLQTSLETLAPQWQSDAATAFYNVNQQWNDDASALNNALRDISTGMHDTAQRYQKMTIEAQQAVQQPGL